jgi:hypothetical protein
VQDAGTGNLYIAGAQLYLTNSDNTKQFLKGDSTGRVDLYYNTSVKLATTATGIDVTGTVVADGLGIGTSSPNAKIEIDNGAEGLYFTAGGDNAANGRSLRFTSSTSSGGSIGALHTIKANSTAGEIAFANGNGNIMYLNESGNVGIGTSAPSTLLDLRTANGVSSTLRLGSSSSVGVNTTVGTIEFYDADSDDAGIKSSISNLITGNVGPGGAQGGNLLFSTALSGASPTERLRIDSSGNVGIGTSSLVANRMLTISGANGVSSIALVRDNNSVASGTIDAIGSDGLVDASIAIGASINGITFSTGSGGATERARVTSSGDLLVGNTAGNSDNVGHGFLAGNVAYHTRAGSTLILNRLSTGGDIALFRKDGATIGRLGTTNGADFYISSSDAYYTGLRFQNSEILPVNSAGGNRSAAIDLGNVNSKFKDIYLSGKITNNGTGGINIATSGSVGIGTTSPPSYGSTFTVVQASNSGSGVVQAQNTTNSVITEIESEGTRGAVGTRTNHDLAFKTNQTERMRITSAGNVGIGGTVDNHGGYARCLQVTGTEAALELESSSGYSYVAQNGVDLQIRNVANGAMPFSTNNTERMRIDSSGNLLVGTTSSSISNTAGSRFIDSGRTLNIVNTGAVYPSIITNQVGYGGPTISFRYTDSQKGYIETTSTNVIYSTTSDYRLKNTIAPMTGALDKVALLKPVTYKWNEDGSDGQGFIAHELAEVMPDAVTGEKDAVDADGNPVYQGIDTSFLVATLTAAIQEQQAIIESLTARVSALEGN